MRAPAILVLSQVYVPDPTSVGQHMADVAEALAARGHRVIVYTSGRGYDDPSVRFERREVRNGVEIRRLPFSSFGKGRMGLRLLGAILFVMQCAVRGCFVRGVGTVLVSTSPPMCSFAALVIRFFRRARLVYWAMDLNPDQIVLLGRAKPTSAFVRAMNWLNRAVLKRSTSVIALDRFMAGRLRDKWETSSKMDIVPPWAHDDHLSAVPHDENPFRDEHGLQGRFVVMFSGNLGFTSPVEPLLEASRHLRDDPRIVFLFVGGGQGMGVVNAFVEESRASNVLTLPYQPLDQLRYSLSAADVHAVTMLDSMVGVVHPCKVYGAMAVERPILFVGPSPSHVSEILDDVEVGWRCDAGDPKEIARVVRAAADLDAAELASMGSAAGRHLTTMLSPRRLCEQVADLVVKESREAQPSSLGVVG